MCFTTMESDTRCHKPPRNLHAASEGFTDASFTSVQVPRVVWRTIEAFEGRSQALKGVLAQVVEVEQIWGKPLGQHIPPTLTCGREIGVRPPTWKPEARAGNSQGGSLGAFSVSLVLFSSVLG